MRGVVACGEGPPPSGPGLCPGEGLLFPPGDAGVAGGEHGAGAGREAEEQVGGGAAGVAVEDGLQGGGGAAEVGGTARGAGVVTIRDCAGLPGKGGVKFPAWHL